MQLENMETDTYTVEDCQLYQPEYLVTIGMSYCEPLGKLAVLRKRDFTKR